jgi:predicted phage terminase large subunit-like protein
MTSSLALVFAEETADQEPTEEERAIAAPQVSLRRFVEMGWHIVEPELAFIPNWHIDAISEHLEWLARGEITRLIINVPPGHAKSLLVSVMFPAWMWTWRPGWRSIFGSYDQELSTRDAVRCRIVLTSDWYHEAFQPSWRFTTDQNVKSFYRNDRMGERLAVSPGGRSTGFRGHCVAVDDPLNVKDAHSDKALETAATWIDQSMSSRLLDPRTGARVMIMQRLHEKDPTGHLLAKGGYVHLMLPSRFEPKRRSVTVLNGVERWRDPRREAGELLFPQLYTPTVLDEAEKKDLGSWGFASQHQQSPLPSTGGIFQKGYFVGGEVETPEGKRLAPDRTYRRAQLPIHFDEHIQSWDMAFKKKDDSDFVVGQVWSRSGADLYLRFERRGRMGTVAHPYAHAKYIEDKANGPAIIEELRGSIPGIIAQPNTDGVEAHAWAIQPFVEAGNVHLPHRSEWPEIDEWLAEVCGYPKAAHDDRVAAFTQAVLRLMRNIGARTPKGRDETRYSEAATIANARY